MKYNSFSDASLMELVCSGNHDAFSEIVDRHTDRYFALAYRTLHNAGDAEDVVQNAFIKLWQSPTKWNSGKSQFTTWFYRVVINACHDHIRRYKNQVLADENVIESAAEPITSEQLMLEKRQTEDIQRKCLSKAIGNLPSSQRDAINLVVYLGLPQKQVAEIMGVSVKAVESLLVRAKRTISEKVKSEESAKINIAVSHV